MIKNIFFDRDGVINEVIFRDSNVESPRKITEFNIRQDFIDFYNKISKDDFNLFVISNQPDIARNKMNSEDLKLMTEQLRSYYSFKEISYCLHDDTDNCNCRKPKPGMIFNLLKKYNLAKEESILVGDSWKDIQAGSNAGIKTILLLNDYNMNLELNPDYWVNRLTEIIKLISEK